MKKIRMKGTPKKALRMSHVIRNIRELENYWEKIKSHLISDDLDYPVSPEEGLELDSEIKKANELIKFLAIELEFFSKEFKLRGFTTKWSLEDIQKWEKKILNKISRKTYINKHKGSKWYNNFSIVENLILEFWVNLLPLIDCLEVPKSSKKYWEILKGFGLGVTASIAASLLIKFLF